MFKINSIKKLLFYLLATVMMFNQNALSKSLPPGSGTGDVKANVLILLDTSASMNGNPFGGAAIYNPNDLILLDDGDVMVGQARGAIIKFDYDTEDFDPTFVDPDGDGKGDRLFQGSNSMPSCELETGRQDSRVRTVREMDKSSDVNGVTPAGKEVIYSISYDYESVVAIDAAGNCVEVISSTELGKTTAGRFDKLYPLGLDIKTIDSEDHLIVTGHQEVCLDERRVGRKKRKRWVCFRYGQEEFVFSKNLSTGNELLCRVNNLNSTFRTQLRSISSISMDSGNNLYYVVNGEIYKISISSNGANFCPSLDAPTRFQRNVNGNVYNLVAKMSIDPQDESIIYATSNTSHTLQKLSINSSNITTSATVGGFGPAASTAANVLFNVPMGLHVSNDRVWVGNAKNSIQEFDISGGSITWVDELGTKVISRAEGAKRAIKAVVNDSSLTSGAYFGYGYWNAGTVKNGKGAKGKWLPFTEYSCHNMCPKAKWFQRCNDYCDYYRGWSNPAQHPSGKSKQCDDNSCIPVGIGPNTSNRIVEAVDRMRTRFGTDGTAFSQLAYEYMLDPDIGVTKDGPECQLNYVIVIGDGMWQHHERALEQIRLLRTDSAAAGVNKDQFGNAKGVKTIFIAYGGGIKDRGDEQFQEAAKAGSCDDPNFGTSEQTDPECRQRIIAENPKELVTKLKSEIERIIASRLSFSAPAITATVQEGGDLFQGQFSLAQGQQWIGHLMRKGVTSDGFVIHKDPVNNWDAAKILAARDISSRKIWTPLQGVSYADSGWNNWVEGNSSEINKLFQILGNTVTDYHKTGSTCPGPDGNEDDIKGLINFVRGADYFLYRTGNDRCSGKGTKREFVLGDIYHSQIVEVGPPGANTNYTATNQEAYYRQKNGYAGFASSKSQRQRVLYVGANDGMLHAFDAQNGDELWGFVPPFIAGKLPEMINDNLDQGTGDNAKGGTNAIFAVDGSPVVHDMFIKAVKPDGQSEATKSWRTILMIPYGRGGAGYSILDVTEPLKPIHVYSVYNDFVRSKVMIALSDGTIINGEDGPTPALNYTGGSLSINDTEEAKNAKFNIERARNLDLGNGGADDYTERDKIKDCVSDSNFYSGGTAACYKGRVWRFPYIMPQEFIDDPSSLPVQKVIDGTVTSLTVDKIEQEASLATITFREELVINLSEDDGSEAADDETTFFTMKIPNIGTENPVYDYSKMGETWATPRIFRLPVEREESIDSDRYVAVMPAGFGKVGGVGSAVYVIDLESMNEQSGGQYPGKIASGGNGLIDLVDIDNTFDSAYGGTLDDLPNAVLGDPVVITPDTFRGAKWRGAMVYVNDYEGKISKINLTNELTSKGSNPAPIELYDHTTLFSLNTNAENGRVSFFGMDAAFGMDTKNLYLFGATGDFNDIARRSRGMDNILYGIRDFDFPNFRMVNSGGVGSITEALNARKIDADDGYTLSPNCVNTADETMDQGDCPAIGKDAWVFKLDKPFDKRQDESLFTVEGSPNTSTQNLYHKATASPTVFKGTVYYPVYQPPEGVKCNVGNAYVCAADDECGINTSEEIGRAGRQMDANAGFDEKTGCYYLQPGVLSKLEVFADKLFANITTDSDDQEDTLISLLSNDGAISVFRGNWRENY